MIFSIKVYIIKKLYLYYLKYYFIKLALQKIASQLSILLEKITNKKEIDAMTKTLDSASTTCFCLNRIVLQIKQGVWIFFF
jgi:hypothetical protein